jgi:hypothetical protein
MPIVAHRDIDYVLYDDFSKDFVVKVENSDSFQEFMTDEIHDLVEESQFHHLESNGSAILIFNDQFKLAGLKEHDQLISFSKELIRLLAK